MVISLPLFGPGLPHNVTAPPPETCTAPISLVRHLPGPTAPVCTQPRACRRLQGAPKVFYLAHFLSLFQSVTIRGVSTKLKVNSGRTNPHGTLPKESTCRQHGIDHLDGFQVSLATTQPLNNAKGVAKSQYSDRTNLQIDQDLHPGPRTFAPVVLPALLSTYLPAQARQTI